MRCGMYVDIWAAVHDTGTVQPMVMAHALREIQSRLSVRGERLRSARRAPRRASDKAKAGAIGYCHASDSVSAITRDIADVTELGATGTPTIMINHLLLRKLPDDQELRNLIRRAAATDNGDEAFYNSDP